MLDDYVFDIILEIVELLEPFKTGSELIIIAKYPTASLLYPIIHTFIKHLFNFNYKFLQDAVNAVLDHLVQRWQKQ